MRVKVDCSSITLGEPIRHELLNEQGVVLFRKEFVFRTQESIDRIKTLALFYVAKDDTPNTDTKTFTGEIAPHFGVSEIEKLLVQTQRLMDGIINQTEKGHGKIVDLVKAAIGYYKAHPDWCLACIHYHHSYPYSVYNPLYSVFLCEMLYGEQLGSVLVEEIASAAYTANLGMYHLHDQFKQTEGKLSPQQRDQINQHPRVSVDILKKLGLKNDLWLQLVWQHHERPDGSGYPKGLSGTKVNEYALGIGIFDTYLSLITPSVSRQAKTVTDTLKVLYDLGTSYHLPIYTSFIKKIGVYPPGTFVRLKSNEIGLVVKRNKGNIVHPFVVVVEKYMHGKPPLIRNTVELPFAIEAGIGSGVIEQNKITEILRLAFDQLPG